MCLGIPGKVVEVTRSELGITSGKVEFGGIVKEVNLSYTPDVEPGLAGSWQFEEGSGTSVADASEFMNDGSFGGSAVWTPGVSGTALDFGGTNDLVIVPDDDSLDISDAITIAAWLRPNLRASRYVIKKGRKKSTDGYELGLSAGSDGAGAAPRLDELAAAGRALGRIDRGELARAWREIGAKLTPTSRSLRAMILERAERTLLEAVLLHTEGNQIRAAALLGINRNTLRKKIVELGIPVPGRE